ncbi:MAG: magnesium chelatase domain-containing protein, partial [Arenimonas sp.]
MSLAQVHSRAKSGVQAPAVRVEVYLAAGLPVLNMVGQPEADVRESRDRVRAAVSCAQLEFPNRRITVNLAPADLKTHCQLNPSTQELFDKAMNALQLSARVTYRILRVARTIADLAGSTAIET